MVLVRSVRPTGNLWAAAWVSASRRWFGVSAGSVHGLVATPLDAGLCPHTPRGDPRIEWRHLFPFAVRLPLHPSQRSRGHNETGVAGMEAALGKSIKNVEGKLVKNTEIGALSAAQKNTSAQVEMLAGQNVKILRLLEVQQDKISFP